MAAEQNIHGKVMLDHNYNSLKTFNDKMIGYLQTVIFLGIQMTVIELNEIIIALQGNGGGSSQNGNFFRFLEGIYFLL